MAISARWYLPAPLVAGFFLSSQAAAPAAQAGSLLLEPPRLASQHSGGGRVVGRASSECTAPAHRGWRGQMCRLSAFLKAIPRVCPAPPAPGLYGSTKFPPIEKSHDL